MKKKVLFLLIAVFVGLAVFLFHTFYDEARKNAIDRLNEQQLIHARQAAQGIEDFFGTWTGILISLARMQEIVENNAAGKRYMGFFFEAHLGQIRSITRVDEKGIILYTVPHSPSIRSDISNQVHVREILKNRMPVVSDVFRAVQGFDGVALHVPVFDGERFKGTIGVVIDFEGLAKRYLEAIRIGTTGYAWVISRDGRQLYSPVPGFTGKPIYENVREFPSIMPMVREMIQGRQGVATYTFDRIGKDVVGPVKKHAVYLPIRLGNTFWSIAVASAESEVLSTLSSYRNKLILVVCAIFLGGILFSLLVFKAWVIVAEEEKRKRMEQALRASEEKFFKAFHATPDAIVITRKTDGRLLEVNEVFVRETGYTREEAIGRTVEELGLWPDAEERDGYAATVKRNGRVQDMETRYRTKSGKILDGLVSGENLDLANEPCLLTIIRDITERKKTEAELERHRLHLQDMVRERTAELERSQLALKGLLDEVSRAKNELEAANERLKELDRLKSLFIASMSHELRTPLNSIIGFTGILLQGLPGPLNDEQKKQLGMVKGSSRHLLDLITDIIDLSKIEAGKIEVNPADFDLKALILEVAALSQPAAMRKGIALAVEGPETLLVRTDERRLRQVLVNLVGNAVKFTERGEVRVTAARQDGAVHIAVRDTGSGIRPEDMGRLFQFFSQITSADMPKHEGTGLGLYLSKKIMALLGGQITAESEYGRGSVFTVTLPATDKETL
ncbi:MAG: PAS domain S-box protein [Deltaproteobacteria bacterium]|nr:PAS domain S-box protein [Deltaproteobacteria bacterium]